MSNAVAEHTYLPTEVAGAAQVLDFMTRQIGRTGRTPAAQFFLAGGSPAEQVQLSPELFEILRSTVAALASGQAVQIAPRAMTLSTQQAADVLGISRPTLLRLLERNAIPYTQLNSHRRLRLDDVLAYREQRKQEQYAALDRMYADDGDRPFNEQAAQSLRAIRKARAAERRAKRP